MTPSRPKRFVLLAVVSGLMLCLAGPALWAVEHPENPSEFGFLLGFELPDPSLTSQPEQIDQLGVLFGLRYAPIVGANLIWSFDGTYSSHTNNQLDKNIGLYTARTSLEYLFPPEWNYRWFVAGSGGWMGGRMGGDLDFDRPMVSVGLGMRGYTSERAIFRWEVRADRALGDNGLNGESVANVQGLFGLSWGMGGPPKDTDGDGVRDSKDKCPDTPRGATVDAYGCPKDTDGDSVLDGIDRCPSTPQGWPVDASGCPLDLDSDRVPDGIDACPNTPRGASVDARGCPSDSDGDGVFNGIDQCPDTPKGATVDAKGCPLDSDGDGVFDGIDRCPGTPRGAKVDAFGCPAPEPKPEPIVKRESPLILEGVNFEFNKATLTPESRPILDTVAASLNDHPDIRIVVEGFTDSVGGDRYNLRLSDERANAVRNYLISKGVAADRLTAKGFGKANPIASNKTAEGRGKNRRVDLKRTD